MRRPPLQLCQKINISALALYARFVGRDRRVKNKKSYANLKLTSWYFQKCTFLIFTLKNRFNKIRHLSALLALTAIVRERHGQIAGQTLSKHPAQ